MNALEAERPETAPARQLGGRSRARNDRRAPLTDEVSRAGREIQTPERKIPDVAAG